MTREKIIQVMKTEPAFPVVGHWYGDKLGGQLFHGMTLRDYFAAQAMMHFCDFGALSDDEYFEQNALAAYKMADTMLKVRAV